MFSLIDRFEEEEFPLAVMYSLTYQGKRMLSDTKCLYQVSLVCNVICLRCPIARIRVTMTIVFFLHLEMLGTDRLRDYLSSIAFKLITYLLPRRVLLPLLSLAIGAGSGANSGVKINLHNTV